MEFRATQVNAEFVLSAYAYIAASGAMDSTAVPLCFHRIFCLMRAAPLAVGCLQATRPSPTGQCVQKTGAVAEQESLPFLEALLSVNTCSTGCRTASSAPSQPKEARRPSRPPAVRDLHCDPFPCRARVVPSDATGTALIAGESPFASLSSCLPGTGLMRYGNPCLADTDVLRGYFTQSTVPPEGAPPPLVQTPARIDRPCVRALAYEACDIRHRSLPFVGAVTRWYVPGSGQGWPVCTPSTQPQPRRWSPPHKTSSTLARCSHRNAWLPSTRPFFVSQPALIVGALRCGFAVSRLLNVVCVHAIGSARNATDPRAAA